MISAVVVGRGCVTEENGNGGRDEVEAEVGKVIFEGIYWSVEDGTSVDEVEEEGGGGA
ncbi:hypothetical protein HMI54_010057 [Coelomomyces lativittatus]|nr:hypothetical protein HMI54_010057 [Coelomomyces lativittatus]